MGDNEATRGIQQAKTVDALIAVLFEVWDNLSVSTINGLITQMPNRLIQVIAGNGHTIQYV
jgi:hypothetical protein